jgi:hypothetical protein
MVTIQNIAAKFHSEELRDAHGLAIEYSELIKKIDGEMQNATFVPEDLRKLWNEFTATFYQNSSDTGRPLALFAAIALCAHIPVVREGQYQTRVTSGIAKANRQYVEHIIASVQESRGNLLACARRYSKIKGVDAIKIQDLCRDIQTI